MGEIRISIPSENLGFPYPVCKDTHSHLQTEEILNSTNDDPFTEI